MLTGNYQVLGNTGKPVRPDTSHDGLAGSEFAMHYLYTLRPLQLPLSPPSPPPPQVSP